MKLKEIMKKFVTLLSAILLATTISFSQNTSEEIRQDSIVSITSSQLKETNLIFAEHWKLLYQNDLLLQQVKNYQKENLLLMQSDSLRVVQLQNYKRLSQVYSEEIDDLNKEISRKNKTIKSLKVGGITVTVGLMLWLLLK